MREQNVALLVENGGYIQGRVMEYMHTLQVKVGEINLQSGLSTRMVYAGIGEPCPDLSLVWKGMQEDKFVLKPPLEELEQSYKDGQATVLVAEVEGREVGVAYIRRSNLLDEKRKLELGLKEKVGSEIQEIGSSFTLPAFRGSTLIDGQKMSYYELMRRMEMARALPDMVAGKLLVIGTSKNKRIDDINIRMNEDLIFKEFGVELFNIVHTSKETENIAPFTCVCTPDFGLGFQFTKQCPKRITQDQLGKLVQLAADTPDREIPCTMYVSNLRLAMNINKQLGDAFSQEQDGHGQFDSQGALAVSLNRLGYYS